MTVTSIAIRFGQKPDEMPVGCCERRKRGEAVSCCPPYSPAELDTFRKEREAAKATPVEVSAEAKQEKKRNIIIRFFTTIPEWVVGFFRSIWDDLKAIAGKLTGGNKK